MTFKKAKSRGQLISTTTPFKGYEIFEYFPDTEHDQAIAAAKSTAQHELNVNNAGKKIKKVSASAKSEGGRKIKVRPTFSMA